MTLAFLMIVLTLSDGGQLSAAFVNTMTLEDCERRAAIVRGILESGDTKIVQMVCRSSDARFEPFAHNVEDGATRYAYIISFDEKEATIEPTATCEAAGVIGKGRYCARSTQNLLSGAK